MFREMEKPNVKQLDGALHIASPCVQLCIYVIDHARIKRITITVRRLCLRLNPVPLKAYKNVHLYLSDHDKTFRLLLYQNIWIVTPHLGLNHTLLVALNFS